MQIAKVLAAVLICSATASATEFVPPSLPVAAGQTLASIAGGAVELAYDSDLVASELPRGRQILLVLSRHSPPQSVAELSDGVWIGLSGVQRPNSPALAKLLVTGLSRDLPKAELEGRAVETALAGFPGMRQQFAVPGRKPLFAPPGDSAEPAIGDLQGWRQLVETDWCTVEIHFVAPEAEYDLREQQVELMLAGMQLSRPRQPVVEVEPDLLDAEPIVGRWKSARGLLELFGDGKITLAFDREKNYELSKRGIVDYESPVHTLAGEYSAEGDLLRIRWADGSLLNMRWRLAGGELLITDHHGRTKRLQRLYR
ncbi:MAG: hypothetical protein AAGF31_11300 [Planctomycetota bacterium]